eukprot:6175474-Pleurochrysis_carterae.AAC.2
MHPTHRPTQTPRGRKHSRWLKVAQELDSEAAAERSRRANMQGRKENGVSHTGTVDETYEIIVTRFISSEGSSSPETRGSA